MLIAHHIALVPNKAQALYMKQEEKQTLHIATAAAASPKARLPALRPKETAPSYRPKNSGPR